MPNGKCYRYPVDYENLKKGNKFGVEYLVALFGHQAGTQEYNFCSLQLRSQIMTEMSKRGNPVTVAIRGMELHVLTDEEAVAMAIGLRVAAEQRLIGGPETTLTALAIVLETYGILHGLSPILGGVVFAVALALLALLWPLRRWLTGKWAASLSARFQWPTQLASWALWFWFLVMLPVAIWAAPLPPDSPRTAYPVP